MESIKGLLIEMNGKLVLTLDDTNCLKGIALILLLLHHLFYIQNGLYSDIHLFGEHYLIQEIGNFGKACVAIFIFLSGYGLETTAETNKCKLSHYYIHRFTKLYLNYWLIWILFVPISVLVFGRSFEVAYGSHVILKGILDFLGLLNIFGLYGYNPTWWFYSTIIVFYLFFPLISRLTKFPLLLILLGVGAYFMPFFIIVGVLYYVLPFLLGIVIAKFRNKNLVPQITPPYARISYAILIVVMGLVFIGRIVSKDKILYDAFITLTVVILYKMLPIKARLKSSLIFLGKHSMNIFLFHTFIYLYWFKSYIYFTSNPLLIFLSLLISCLAISFAIERIKTMINFRFLIQKIEIVLCRIIRE